MKSTAKESNRKASVLRVKLGTVDEFFSTVGEVMRAADKGEPIKPRVKTLSFEDPVDMLHFLSASKLVLIQQIKQHPDSITNLARITRRKVSAIARDVNELEKVGIVKSHSVINPGHGRHKIIELAAKKLRLEASL